MEPEGIRAQRRKPGAYEQNHTGQVWGSEDLPNPYRVVTHVGLEDTRRTLRGNAEMVVNYLRDLRGADQPCEPGPSLPRERLGVLARRC